MSKPTLCLDFDEKERAMILFWHQTGPLLKYEDGALHVEDLNPHMQAKWRMSRKEMLLLGLRCLRAAWSAR